jgi:hypothetical protein
VQPTHVIHLAAKVGGLFANMKAKVRECFFFFFFYLLSVFYLCSHLLF